MQIKYSIILLIMIVSRATSQPILKSPDRYPDTSRFSDSARHWYRIFDDDRVIEPLPDQQRYETSEIGKIADNILLFQKNNGGWAKNYDMRAILSEEQTKAVKYSKGMENTTFDNGATHAQLTYLAEAYSILKVEKYKEGFLKGLQFVLNAQYKNGGWPQFYPDTSGYHKHITFNDNAMSGIMEMLRAIVSAHPEYNFIDDNLRARISESFQKGIDCILKCQIVENGVKTAWCQQHDHIDLSPQDARTFEKASICNLESSELTKLLMEIDNPDKDIIEAIQSAVKWFKESEIHAIRVKWIESTQEKFIYHSTKYDKIVVEDPDAPRIWARFYELGTHRPIFCGRDGVVHYSMAEVDRDRRTGYGWYNYAPEEVYRIYKKWCQDWQQKNVLQD